MKQITKKQIAEIARETKELEISGYGMQLAIFRDGRTSLQPSRLSLTCFVADDGTRTYPLCWISTPQSRAGVKEIVRTAEHDVAYDEAAFRRELRYAWLE